MIRLKPGQHIHLVGIGGFGISAIARILLGQGYHVTGSDRAENEFTRALKRDGAKVYIGHDPKYVDGADAVLRSSAVPYDHIELQAAKDRRIPIYKRNDIIAGLMEGKTVIAVAGTHGKTTTTAMIVHILQACGKDPSYIVGGVMGNTKTNASIGSGDMFVIEADEYDNMFLGLKPNVIVLTSLEYDHPDFFRSEDHMISTFEQFVHLLNFGPVDSIRNDGFYPWKLILCADDPNVMRLRNRPRDEGDEYDLHTYGVTNLDAAEYQGVDLRVEKGQTYFSVQPKDAKKPLGEVCLPLMGRHMVQNALAALIVAGGYASIDFKQAAKALQTFKSTGRRFDVRGAIDEVVVIDDYAHHPTAIDMTLEAAKMRWPEREIWAVWQPHTYSRTEALLSRYSTAFGHADHVVVTDIYASRETPTEDSITAASLPEAIQHEDVTHTPTLEDATDFLVENVKPPAVVVIMSAGDAPKIGQQFLKQYQV